MLLQIQNKRLSHVIANSKSYNFRRHIHLVIHKPTVLAHLLGHILSGVFTRVEVCLHVSVQFDTEYYVRIDPKCTDLYNYLFMRWLLHVSARQCHHQGATRFLLRYFKIW
jgi:hypothetical protein